MYKFASSDGDPLHLYQGILSNFLDKHSTIKYCRAITIFSTDKKYFVIVGANRMNGGCILVYLNCDKSIKFDTEILTLIRTS